MIARFFSTALVGSLLATTALAQVGGGSSAGPGSGAPGTTSSGTAGTSPSTSNPSPGASGLPGPASGAGIPGGPGPGNTTVVPNFPSMPQSGQTVGRDSGGNIGASPNASGNSSGSGGPSVERTRLTVNAAQSDPTRNFNPEAVTTQGLEAAARDIRAMHPNELRDLVRALDACTSKKGHPTPRSGGCAKANRHYQVSYGKHRAIDRTLREFDRVVRFQNMFDQTGPRHTEYEDGINEKLRTAAKSTLAEATIDEQTRRDAASPRVTRDAHLPTR